MEIKTDIQIAQEAQMTNIRAIAAAAGIDERYLEMYGRLITIYFQSMQTHLTASWYWLQPYHRHLRARARPLLQ